MQDDVFVNDDGSDAATRPPWLDDASDERAIGAAIEWGAPARSLALYARWWQLETWLRDLAYLELRTKQGVAWENEASTSNRRQGRDALYSHMSGPDNDNPLAYLDYSQLLEVIERHWSLFDQTLIEKQAWDGRQVELSHIRHRIGHARRPHADDLSRIEQTLRDLEGGAFLAISEYNHRWTPPEHDRQNAVADGWVNRQHPVAKRLLDHAERRYDTTVEVRRSFRPWSGIMSDESKVGQLWHVDFQIGPRAVNIGGLWRDLDRQPISDLLVHLTSDLPGHVGFVFSAADDATEIADAIGIAFEAVLGKRDHKMSEWQGRASHVSTLDFRIKIGTPWNVVERSTLPINIFGAGGGLYMRPKRPSRSE